MTILLEIGPALESVLVFGMAMGAICAGAAILVAALRKEGP